MPNGSVSGCQFNHPLGFNWHPLRGAGWCVFLNWATGILKPTPVGCHVSCVHLGCPTEEMAPPQAQTPQPLQAWEKKILGEMFEARQRVGFIHHTSFCLKDGTLKDDDPDPFCVESLVAKFVHC